MSRRIFLTGATGYIGGVLARRLLAGGDALRVLVRPSSDAAAVAALRDLGAEVFEGDVTDRFSLREGMAGADWVVHAAADLDLQGDGERMRRINVDGADNVASLAYKLGCGRMLHVSSIAAFGGSPEDGTPATEETPRRPDFPSLYAATKHASEQVVRAWAKKGLRLNVAWPSLVYGPPGKASGTNALLRLVARGRLPVLVAGGRRTSWVHVDDLVEGLVRVMAGAEPGRDYLLAGEVRETREVVAMAAALGGRRGPRVEVPLWVARWGLGGLGVLLSWRGRPGPLDPRQLGSLGRHWAFSDERARGELGWGARGLEEGLPGTVESLLAEGADEV